MNCKRCGNCCERLLPLTNAEKSNIKKYIKENNIKLIKSNRYCPFLKLEVISKCSIYEVRPQICRDYHCGYTQEDLKNAEIFKTLKYKKSITDMQKEFIK